MTKALFFDLDGTLIDSAPDLADAVNFMLKQLGKRGYNLATIRSWIGGGATLLIQRALSGKKEPKNIEEQLLNKAKEHFFAYYEKNLCNKTKAFPNAKETLQTLKKRYPLALITNKPERFIKPILKHLELDFFDLIIGGDTLPEKKPSPLPLLHACNHFGIGAKEAIMVGDSYNDIEAAKRASIVSVLVTYGYESQKLDSHYIINNLNELLELV